MRRLLNTLYVTSEDAFLSLEGENVVISRQDEEDFSIPLHLLEGIVSFSYKGATPALMGKCAGGNIPITFYTPRGKFLVQVGNDTNGNVFLRREQYRIADEAERSLNISRNMIIAKVYNAKYVLLRCARDHELQCEVDRLREASTMLSRLIKDLESVETDDSLRGIEGNAAAVYFGVFNELILQNKEDFSFNGRNRRPPLDRVNAMLSFAYSLLTNECASALRSVGLDPYVGFLHTDRPGRKSLALDLVEELRSAFADRFILTLINNRVLDGNDFLIQPSGEVLLKDKARKVFLSEWQKRKKETITHPFLKEKIAWGLVPFVQAQLLARHIRGDIEQYPPFFHK